MVTHILQGYSKNKAYIIAQSPMDNTVIDFWKMIVNYQVSAIVMMCDEFETQQVNHLSHCNCMEFNYTYTSKSALHIGIVV